MTPYLNLFIDSIWNANIISLAVDTGVYAAQALHLYQPENNPFPASSNPGLAAMKAFGGYNMPLASAIAVAGAIIGQSLNWLLGWLLLQLKNAGSLRISEKAYNVAHDAFFKYYVFFLLLFGWATGGNVLVIIAAFLGARYLLVLPLVALGYAGHLAFFLLS